MRSGSAPFCSCQRRLYAECGASASAIRYAAPASAPEEAEDQHLDRVRCVVVEVGHVALAQVDAVLGHAPAGCRAPLRGHRDQHAQPVHRGVHDVGARPAARPAAAACARSARPPRGVGQGQRRRSWMRVPGVHHHGQRLVGQSAPRPGRRRRRRTRTGRAARAGTGSRLDAPPASGRGSSGVDAGVSRKASYGPSERRAGRRPPGAGRGRWPRTPQRDRSDPRPGSPGGRHTGRLAAVDGERHHLPPVVRRCPRMSWSHQTLTPPIAYG